MAQSHQKYSLKREAGETESDSLVKTESDTVVTATLLVLKMEEGATSLVSFPLEFLEGVQAN